VGHGAGGGHRERHEPPEDGLEELDGQGGSGGLPSLVDEVQEPILHWEILGGRHQNPRRFLGEELDAKAESKRFLRRAPEEQLADVLVSMRRDILHEVREAVAVMAGPLVLPTKGRDARGPEELFDRASSGCRNAKISSAHRDPEESPGINGWVTTRVGQALAPQVGQARHLVEGAEKPKETWEKTSGSALEQLGEWLRARRKKTNKGTRGSELRATHNG